MGEFRREHIGQFGAQKKERLEYIRALLRELAQMAEAEREPLLAYLIAMAYFEAADTIRLRYHKDVDFPMLAG